MSIKKYSTIFTDLNIESNWNRFIITIIWIPEIIFKYANLTIL